MNAKKFGQFICTLRQEKGLTQKELADKIGVTVNEIISCRCLGTDEILPESDKNIVRIIKINRRQKRSFSIILAMLLVFILISGLYTYGRLSGLDGRAVNRTYDISLYPPQGNSALPGGENNLGLDILRYRRSASLNSDQAVSLTCLFQVIEALDMNTLLCNQTEISFFNLRYCGIRNGKGMDLAVNSAVDYIFDGCSIRPVMSDEEFSGSYALFYLSGFAPSDDGNGYSANDDARAFIWVPQ